MSRNKKKNGIPDRWLDYKAVGRRLDGTRFIAFKVPLKQSLNRQLSGADVFGPWELMDALKKQKQDLGLVIDLTFTTRYYKLQDLPESLLFVKIYTMGHEIPSDDTILSFKRAVRRFLRDNRDNDKLIGVHCTHGLNRTGYLICRYLIDVDGMDPAHAIELFNLARGHAIERQNYLRDLQTGPKRSNVGMEESEQEPQWGCAKDQPCNAPSERYHRPFPLRHPHPPRNSLLPTPPLLPTPFLCPPTGAPFQPYRWAAPQTASQQSRPLMSAGSRSRYSPPEPVWGPAPRPQQDRRGPPPHWTHQNRSYDGAEEERSGPRMRHHYRVNGPNRTYDRY